MRKLIALEPDVYEKLKQNHSPMQKHERPEVKILSELDKKMTEILQSNRPDHEKMKLYNEALQKNKLYRKKIRPKTIKTIVQEQQRPITEDKLLNRYKKKTRAKKVLKSIRDNSNSGWDSDGRFIFDNQPVPSSDIKKLLHAAVSKPDRTLPGWKQFSSLVKWQTI